MWIIGVAHLSNLLEAELIGGELIGKASRPGRKLLCDVPHTVGELVPVKTLHGLELRALLWEVLVAAREPCDHQNQEVITHHELNSFGSEE